MQKQLSIAALAACLLFANGCKKTDLTEEGLKVNSDLKLPNIINAVEGPCDVISFETAAAGTLISSITSEDGVSVAMTSSNSSNPEQKVAAMVFDSDVPHSEDGDLGTPSQNYGGPGYADNANKTGMVSNKEPLNNILIIQNFKDYGTTIPNDDDNRDKINESITFDFSSVGTVMATSITVIDVEVKEERESGWVLLYDAAGTEIGKYAFPETWENGVATIYLGNTAGVRKIALDINGSIGFDNLRFCLPPPPPPCDVISFESATPGTLISSVLSENGVTVAMTSTNSSSPLQPVAAMVFDSDVPHSEDGDLGTPSQNYGGPGYADNANKTGMISNHTPLHNIVVIQNFKDYGTTIPNDDDNRDNINESITFDFSSVGTVMATSITVIDVEIKEERESGYVILYDVNGVEIKRFPFPETWENGVAVISLENTKGVESIKLDINGSIGFDNLQFCVEETPPTGCTRTQGYWKTHGPSAKGNNNNEWDVTQMMLGSKIYTAEELQLIFNIQPKKGNGLVSLAHQLIAAKLNIANGAGYSTAVTDAIAAADALIGGLVIPPVGSGMLSPSVTSSLTNTLDMYNNGKLGTPHCDD